MAARQPGGVVVVACLHALEESEEPIAEAFEREWPEAHVVHLNDFALSRDRASGAADESNIESRVLGLAEAARDRNASAILFTGTAFGAAVDAAQAAHPSLPILRPNEAAFREAAACSSDRSDSDDRTQPIHLLVTFPPSLARLEAELVRELSSQAQRDALRCHLVHGALDDLRAGRGDAHDRKVAEAAARAVQDHAHPGGVVVLGQFSMARAASAVREAMPRGVRVITTPDAAVREIRRRLDG